jgi:hypothetical protein
MPVTVIIAVYRFSIAAIGIKAVCVYARPYP